MIQSAVMHILLAEQSLEKTQGLSLTYLLSLLILAVLVLLFLILKLRMQAFLALILASLFVAIGSSKELSLIHI